MNSNKSRRLSNSSIGSLSSALLALSLGLAACSTDSKEKDVLKDKASRDDQEVLGGASGQENPSPGVSSGGAQQSTELEPSDDPGFKGIHRLNSREYDATLRDLVGTELRPGQGLLNESGHGFDNLAASLGMTATQYAAYFRAAGDVAQDVFANDELRARVLSCDTAGDKCATEIVKKFGLRAFRRPLLGEEIDAYVAVYQRAAALGLSHGEATQEVVRAFLSSAEFLYRIEFDSDPASATPHPVNDFEMASRLSYFLWGTMPDDNLLAAASEGELMDGEMVSIVGDMLDDSKSAALVDALAWQWLGMKNLESHAVLTDVLPEWDEELREDLLLEARVYLDQFIIGDVRWNDFFTVEADAGPLIDFYGDEQSERQGFLGLGAFLTVSSFAHRTSPTLRAKWILEELLCSPPPAPPPNIDIPDLEESDDSANLAAQLENVRERLQLHRTAPGCANCHRAMDPLGMALENFDALGRFREDYENGDPVDPTASMPDGTSFDGLQSLAEFLAQDERFYECSTERTLVYALGRGLEREDQAHLAQIRRNWNVEEGASFLDLVREVIESVPFQNRRGEDL